MEKEKDLQSKILNDLRSLGKYCEVFKIMKASDNGVPDIFFTTAHSGPVFVETKKAGEKASKLQSLKIKKLNMCGVSAFTCSSWENWIKIKQVLGGFSLESIVDCHNYRNRLLS